ncbi:hypothetical protein AB0I39_16895 [Kitasatospora purpeofusca]|uniref:hypothetical protein n=1 Tax=Kitasatospora purpeofusca TaxID=67352 RepID=UPI0033DFF8DF
MQDKEKAPRDGDFAKGPTTNTSTVTRITPGADSAERPCDFCDTEGPAWSYGAGAFTRRLPGTPVAVAFVGPWLACEPCAALVDGDQWGRLLRRRQSLHAASHGAIGSELLGLWLTFESRRTGPARPLGVGGGERL